MHDVTAKWDVTDSTATQMAAKWDATDSTATQMAAIIVKN